MYFISLILRVRQSCCHASLVPSEVTGRSLEILNHVREKCAEDIDVEEAEELLDRLRGAFDGMESVSEECCICFESIGEESARVLRTCKHVSRCGVHNTLLHMAFSPHYFPNRSFVLLASTR